MVQRFGEGGAGPPASDQAAVAVLELGAAAAGAFLVAAGVAPGAGVVLVETGDRLAGLGVLVAAGPLSPIDDVPDGARGMTVVRVPAADVDRFADLARTDDQSVVRGLLDVTVSRWTVVRR